MKLRPNFTYFCFVKVAEMEPKFHEFLLLLTRRILTQEAFHLVGTSLNIPSDVLESCFRRSVFEAFPVGMYVLYSIVETGIRKLTP